MAPERWPQYCKGIERMRRLTEQLLNLARSQAGSAEKIPVKVSEMARELIAEYLPLAEVRDIGLNLDDTGNIVLVTEAQTLRVVLKSALENALRYTPSQGEVTLRVYSEREDAIIEIIDSDPGIPPAERERVFAPFYRLDGTCGEGSGLGLSIARAAASLSMAPDEVWCAAGSGVLARGLARAWPGAKRHVVQVGRALYVADVAGAAIHEYPVPFGREARTRAPFPSDPHYDAKAWEQCAARRGPGRVVFWNVAGPAKP